MNHKQLLALANQKAVEAQAILEAEAPDVEKANALMAEAEGYKARAEAMRKAMTLAEATEAKPEPKPEKSGITIVTDEADNALKAQPYKSFGQFLVEVRNAALGQPTQRILPLRSADPEDSFGFSLNGAMGDDFVGGLTKAAYRKSAFAKQTGLNEGLGAEGGFLVGTDRGGSLMERVYNIGDILRRVDMVGISPGSNGMTFAGTNETSRANGSRHGGILSYWTAEGGTKQSSKPAFRELELRLHKLTALVVATDELLQDANALESWILSHLPDEIRFRTEDAFINGTGVGMPQGIRASGALVTQAAEAGQAADTIVTQNIVNMWSRMWAPSRRNAVWLYNQDIEPQLFQLNLGVGTGGVALYMPPGGLSQAPYSTLLGRPCIPSEYSQTLGDEGDLMLLDFSQYQAIEKGSIQSASSVHVYFTTDETCYRFVYRVHGISTWNAPLTPFNSTITQSPCITLAAR